MDEPVLKVELTAELRVIALDHLIFASHAVNPEDRSRLEVAFQNSPPGMMLRTSYRIEADMIVILADALRTRTYLKGKIVT